MKKQHIIEVNESFCIGCGICKEDCPSNNIMINDKKAIIKTQDCIKCDHCAAICPKQAITLTGFDDEAIEFTKQTTVDSNELLMELKSRRSIRKFKDKKVPIEVIQQIIEAGRFTPTAKNAQDISYVILDKSKDESEKIEVKFFKKIKPVIGLFMKSANEVNIDDDFFFKKSPVVIMVVTKDKISGSLAASNMAFSKEQRSKCITSNYNDSNTFMYSNIYSYKHYI